ncbi:MAG: hypothetical protein M3072_15680 [Candidatus Dormibacteraeota bacterium]|nr:hypothetical protein [Candidatus Dormibacteraeota bacterium]
MIKRAGMGHRFLGCALSLVGALAMVMVGPTTGRAEGSVTSITGSHLQAVIVENLCNGDEVNLNGDLTTIIVTTPGSNGSFTATSLNVAPNLSGVVIGSEQTQYKAVQGELSIASYTSEEVLTKVYDVAWIVLVPVAGGPRMYLIAPLIVTYQPDGTNNVVLEKMYVICRPPARNLAA